MPLHHSNSFPPPTPPPLPPLVYVKHVGNNQFCPNDKFVSATAVCRAQNGDCDAAETCTGTGAACPDDIFTPSTQVCRPTNGQLCDIAEQCTGRDPVCPADVLVSSGTTCRASRGDCGIRLCFCSALVCKSVGGWYDVTFSLSTLQIPPKRAPETQRRALQTHFSPLLNSAALPTACAM